MMDGLQDPAAARSHDVVVDGETRDSGCCSSCIYPLNYAPPPPLPPTSPFDLPLCKAIISPLPTTTTMRPLPLLLLLLPTATTPLTLTTFDGPGFPSCLAPISQIHTPPSIPSLQSLIRAAARAGHRVRAAGAGHSWYDTQCSTNTSVQTVILRTDSLTGITDLSLPGGGGGGGGGGDGGYGTVVVEAGVTFFQLAAYLHERGASVGYALTNWNITFGGAVAMGAHRSSLREASMVAAGAEGVEIVDAAGGRRWVGRGDGRGEEWAAASTSLGLLGVVVRVKLRVWEDTKVFAMQTTWVLPFLFLEGCGGLGC